MGNRRTMLLILLVVVVGGVAALLLIMNQGSAPVVDNGGGGQEPTVVFNTPVPIRVASLVIAVQNIPRGSVIPENGVQIREWPQESVPLNSTDDARLVIGSIARTDIPVESPILLTQITDNLDEIAARGSDAALIIPPGKVAISIPIDRLTNVANAPMTGDYVDVILSFLFVDVDEEFQTRLPNKLTLTTIRQDGTIEFQTGLEGRVEPSGDFTFPVVVGPSEVQRPRLVTQRTVQAAFVLYVGTFPDDGDFLGRRPTPTPLPTPSDGEATPTPAAAVPTATTPPKDMITLAVDPQDAVVLVWAIESRLPITFALRSATDLAIGETQAVTLEYMINTYNVPQPPRLPYALEPAIRSIRRLVLGNEITFVDVSN
ncbi:MAG TPA: Flp pilus assembly protein CpaB [Aggregatilineales bacterium]|nr:Flp pilus assembly protein CpaB [Aggregatilineales bacterium]